MLRVIEYGEFERVGGSRTIKTDVRLIAATNEDLPALAERNEFRADLLDRLAFDVITLPPLRERREDIMLLAEHFAIQMAREMELELFSGFTTKARQTLLDYDWPGNVRELKNVIERSVYRLNNAHVPVSSIVLDPFDSPYRPSARPPKTGMLAATVGTQQAEQPHNGSSTPEHTTHQEHDHHSNNHFPLPDFNSDCDFKEITQGFEIQMLRCALAKSQFNQKKTAEKLGLTYHQLRGYLKKYQLLDAQGEE